LEQILKGKINGVEKEAIAYPKRMMQFLEQKID
jgi:hypothetical protein